MDQTREKIRLYTLFFTAALTGFYGTSGWWFLNYGIANNKRIVVCTVVVIAFFMFLLGSIYKIKYYINKLEDNHA